jgi:hypothetical protein
MLRLIARILVISSPVTGASMPDRLERLRALADNLKAIIPADRPPKGSSVSEAILEKALKFVDRQGEGEFVQGLEIMNLVCSSGLGRGDVDNLIWKAIGVLCAPTETTTIDPSNMEEPVDNDRLVRRRTNNVDQAAPFVPTHVSRKKPRQSRLALTGNWQTSLARWKRNGGRATNEELVARTIAALTNGTVAVFNKPCGCPLGLAEPTVNFTRFKSLAAYERQFMDALGIVLAEQVARNETELIVNVVSVLMDLEAPVYSILRIGYHGMLNKTRVLSARDIGQARAIEKKLNRETNDVTESFRLPDVGGGFFQGFKMADNPSAIQRKLARFAIGSASDLGVLRFIQDLLRIAGANPCSQLHGGLLNGHYLIQTRRGIAYKPSSLPSFQYSDESWTSMRYLFMDRVLRHHADFVFLSKKMAGRDASEEFRFLHVLGAPPSNIGAFFLQVNQNATVSDPPMASIYPNKQRFLLRELFALCGPAPTTPPVLQEYEEKLATWAVQDFEKFQFFYMLAKTAQVPLVFRQIVFRKSCAILATLSHSI